MTTFIVLFRPQTPGAKSAMMHVFYGYAGVNSGSVAVTVEQ